MIPIKCPYCGSYDWKKNEANHATFVWISEADEPMKQRDERIVLCQCVDCTREWYAGNVQVEAVIEEFM